jgi:hypothetical protein
MWKTERRRWPSLSETQQVCPDCDSLGPHPVVSDDDSWDVWLDCIDCGARLGRLTPEGLESPGADGCSDPTAPPPLEPRDAELLHELLERTRLHARYPDPAVTALLVAARARLELPVTE